MKKAPAQPARPKARGGFAFAHEVPLTQQDINKKEAEREKHLHEFLAAQEDRHAERMKEIMAEQNRINGRLDPDPRPAR